MKSKQRKYRQPNNALRSKREKETVHIFDFPIEIRVKPTAHKQYCFACREPVEKRKLQVKIASGMWETSGNHHRSVMKDTIWAGSYHTYRTRYLYFHCECFQCVLKKMFAKVGLSLIADCENCGNRFNCYTNNINIENINSQPTYTPSRVCKNE